MTFAALIGNIWFRRALLAVVVLIALLGVRQHYINLGKTQGSQNEAQQSANEGAKQVKDDHNATVTQITQLTQQINVLQKQVDNTQTLIMAIVQQRQQATQQVQGMSADQVQALINQALGKPQNASGFDTDDKRRILDCFTQLPLCNQQNEQYAAKIDGLEQKSAKQDEKYGHLADYAVNLERNYTELWNEKAIPKRSGKCLWLWKCSRPKISQPNPVELKPKSNV